MKNLNLIITLLILCIVFIACDKQDENAPDTTVLTPCREGYACTYSFFNNTKLETGGTISKGSYRVFQSESKREGITELLTIEDRSAASTTFTMDKNEIVNGQVKPGVICPACDYILLKPVDGLISGRKISDTKWLLDISVTMAYPTTGKIADTVKVKQVFNASKI